jgi:hypothetical protein
MHTSSRRIVIACATLTLGFSTLGCGTGPSRAAVAHSGAVLVRAASPCGGNVPAALVAPPGNKVAFQLEAVGVQIYTCTATTTGATWTLTAPEATLHDAARKEAGTHYAGPTWEAKDGSKVVGARLAAATPDPASIPWLLLGAASHSGEGRMAEVTFVQRLDTSGGIAPTDGCDPDHLGAVRRVDYTATYCFYVAD